MAELVWTPRAYADLETIGAYHAQSAPGYAAVLIRKLMHTAERQKRFLLRVVWCQRLETKTREIIHRNYRIIYLHLPEDERVEVLTVFHSSRQFGALPGPADS